MANIAVARIKREFKEVVKSEEVWAYQVKSYAVLKTGKVAVLWLKIVGANPNPTILATKLQLYLLKVYKTSQ